MEQFWSADMEGGDLRMQNPYWINYRNPAQYGQEALYAVVLGQLRHSSVA